MASKITVTEGEISNIVKTLQEEQSNITTYRTKLISELERVNAAWKGSDATKYTEKMHDDYSTLLDEYSKCFQTYIDFLSKVYSEYKAHDDKWAGKSIDF